MIRKEENNITVQEFNYLNTRVGWGRWEEEAVEEALKNTLYSVSIYEDDIIVGYGRIIGDKAIFLYIHDVMVVPPYQGKKIGTMIMDSLLEKVDEYKKINPSIRTYLGATKGCEKFYEKFGFKTRSEANLGEEMVLLQEPLEKKD